MQIEIPLKALRAAVKTLPAGAAGNLAWKAESRRDEGSLIEIDIGGLPLPVLQALHKAAKDEEHGSSRLLAGLIKAIKDPENKRISTLSSVPTVLSAYMEASSIRGWVIEQNEATRPVAWLMSDCEYYPPDGRRDTESLVITLRANAKHTFRERKIYMGGADTRGRTIVDILSSFSLVIDSEDLLEEYDRVHKRYLEFRDMQAEQFMCKGFAYLEVSRRNRKDYDWWWDRETKVDLAPVGEPTLAILDEEGFGEDRGDERGTYPVSLYKKIRAVPWHPLLHCFHLKHHQNTWINARQLKPYEYDEDLPSKLIMPKTHVGLVNALTSNIFVKAIPAEEGKKKSRVIRSKAQSTIILCRGPAGTGKTLLAEVYAEKLHRPLYEVNSGEIGTEPDDVEENLKDILERSKRLRAPLVINEADVFVQERGTDLKQNAVCTVFLRCLEYHNGLIFLTTNRDNIDDAILSRCLAIIDVALPDEEGRLALWAMLAQELDLEITEKTIEEAASKLHPVSGRDIQNLIRLVKRRAVAEKIDSVSYKLIRNSAAFRGIKIHDDK